VLTTKRHYRTNLIKHHIFPKPNHTLIHSTKTSRTICNTRLIRYPLNPPRKDNQSIRIQKSSICLQTSSPIVTPTQLFSQHQRPWMERSMSRAWSTTVRFCRARLISNSRFPQCVIHKTRTNNCYQGQAILHLSFRHHHEPMYSEAQCLS
jgi:hypothetical protein